MDTSTATRDERKRRLKFYDRFEIETQLTTKDFKFNRWSNW